ncbi:laccase-1 precursor [Halenospora varia]|nr:laccase-1 precursor [Halenospora varia]
MLVPNFLLGSLALGLTAASALPEAKLTALHGRQSEAGGCDNSQDRTQWCGKGTIKTDGEATWPNKDTPAAAATKTFNIEVAEATLAPDGIQKPMLVINGTYPGPTIIADWGDVLIINVKNSMKDNGTSMHWHGISQANTTTEDGVNGVTECPIPPLATRQYKFTATQFGTTWYHSHYSGQYGDGVLGTMIINGPAAEQYAEDLGTFPITDHFHKPIYQVGVASEHGGPPKGEAALINGTMLANGLGAYANVTVTANKTYRLRIINTSVDNGWKFSLDGHPFTVIQADFVPIKSFKTNWIFVAIGQRYDVVFTTDQTPGNYWFRAEIPTGLCGSNTLSTGAIGSTTQLTRAVLKYVQGTTTSPSLPTSTPLGTYLKTCADETALSPLVEKVVPSDGFVFTQDRTDQMNVSNVAQPVNQWFINTEKIQVDWTVPSLKYVVDNNVGTLQKITGNAVYVLDKPNHFYFWVIQNQGAVPHPIHLHGHDFYILGATNTTETTNPMSIFTGSADDMKKLNFGSPMRRDVATLPGNGWLVIAFHTNNPGMWLMHCHIAWHVSQGLGVQFLERESELRNQDLTKVQENCKAWDAWYQTTSFKIPDSGLKFRA